MNQVVNNNAFAGQENENLVQKEQVTRPMH